MKEITQSIVIEATPALVWATLTGPDAGQKWRNAEFETDWTIGVPFEILAKMGGETYRGWKHWEFYWRVTLPVLKAVVERGSG